MKPSRAIRFAAAVVAVISLLFTQLALASYACPGLAMPVRMAVAADGAMGDMADCTGMDTAQPGLCHAHSHSGHQSLDKPELPRVAPFHAAGLVLTLAPADPTAAMPATRTAAPMLARATSPPLAICHCCFRI